MHLPSHPNLHGWCICRWRLVRSEVKLQPFVPCVWTSWRACSHWAKPCEVCKCRSKLSFHCSTGVRILENFGQDKHGQTLHGFTMALPDFPFICTIQVLQNGCHRRKCKKVRRHFISRTSAQNNPYRVNKKEEKKKNSAVFSPKEGKKFVWEKMFQRRRLCHRSSKVLGEWPTCDLQMLLRKTWGISCVAASHLQKACSLVNPVNLVFIFMGSV